MNSNRNNRRNIWLLSDSQKSSTFDTSLFGFIKGKKGKGRFSFSLFANRAVWQTRFYNGRENSSCSMILQSINRRKTTSESTIKLF